MHIIYENEVRRCKAKETHVMLVTVWNCVFGTSHVLLETSKLKDKKGLFKNKAHLYFNQ